MATSQEDLETVSYEKKKKYSFLPDLVFCNDFEYVQLLNTLNQFTRC